MSERVNRFVMIVDADAHHRDRMRRGLMSHYDLRAFKSTERVLDEMIRKPPALLIVTHDTFPDTAEQFIEKVRAHEDFKTVRIVYIASSETDERIDDVLKTGASTYVTKPYPASVLIKSMTGQLNKNIEHMWGALPETPRNALKSSLDVFHNIADVLMSGETVSFSGVKNNCQPLVDVIASHDFDLILEGVKNHDDYTYAHSMRVATFLSLLGNEAGFKNDEQLILASGGLLHDVGKMMIPHHILNKPGRLTDEEFEIIKTHVPETIDYLKRAGDIPKPVFIIAEQHHEKIDGTGYPNGLKGKELNELARMAAVVDVFSALTDRRVYKDPMPMDKALKIMREEMTNHLDQKYVIMFESILYDSNVTT